MLRVVRSRKNSRPDRPALDDVAALGAGTALMMKAPWNRSQVRAGDRETPPSHSDQDVSLAGHGLLAARICIPAYILVSLKHFGFNWAYFRTISGSSTSAYLAVASTPASSRRSSGSRARKPKPQRRTARR